jgi:hypothetical protein
MKKAWKCEWCGSAIDAERVIVATSRGVEPRYCSDKCRNAARTARYRARKKGDATP